MSSRTVIITGGGSGIGKATALRFAGLSDLVFVADRQFTAEAKAELEGSGVVCRTLDVCHTEELTECINDIAAQTGRIDVLVNNAGMGLVKQIGDVSEAEWDAVMNTNLKAAFFGCKAAIPIMMKQASGGAIINVASNAGLLPRAHDPVYSISKLALVGLTKSLALCHSKDKIRINSVCPGPVANTQMIEENFENRSNRSEVVRELISASPLAKAWGRMISPEEIADTIVYLSSDAARMVSGTSIAIDGGKSLGVPPSAD